MIRTPEAPPSRAITDERPADPEPCEPNIYSVAILLAMRIAGIGRGGIARDIAADLEALALPANELAAEYRVAAAMLRHEADERARLYRQVEGAYRRPEGGPK